MATMKHIGKILAALLAVSVSAGCGAKKDTEKAENEKLMIAAAASLEYSLENEIIPMFTEKYGIEVEGTYDSSGKLQLQIENGLEADLFFSAAEKQMDALDDGGYMDSGTISPLLENKIVLISSGDTAVTSFENINDAPVIAIGDPEIVPAGQYAREALSSLGLWDEALSHASLGSNVTEVLNWVEAGSAEVGVVYATDAAQADVRVIAEAPEGSLEKPVIYPVGVLKNSKHRDAAIKFEEFLKSDDAAGIFEKYGFTVR